MHAGYARIAAQDEYAGSWVLLLVHEEGAGKVANWTLCYHANPMDCVVLERHCLTSVGWSASGWGWTRTEGVHQQIKISFMQYDFIIPHGETMPHQVWHSMWVYRVASID